MISVWTESQFLVYETHHSLESNKNFYIMYQKKHLAICQMDITSFCFYEVFLIIKLYIFFQSNETFKIYVWVI